MGSNQNRAFMSSGPQNENQFSNTYRVPTSGLRPTTGPPSGPPFGSDVVKKDPRRSNSVEKKSGTEPKMNSVAKESPKNELAGRFFAYLLIHFHL